MILFIALCACQVLHIVDFLGSRRMETAPTSIEVLLRPTQSQSDEPSDLRGSLSPTSVYSTWQSPGGHPSSYKPGGTSVIEPTPMRQHRIPVFRIYSVVLNSACPNEYSHTERERICDQIGDTQPSAIAFYLQQQRSCCRVN